MTQHLLLTIRLHGDRQGSARFHGLVQGSPEWPPAPARVFQALIAGAARGHTLPGTIIPAFEWLEGLAPPLIAAPHRQIGERVSLFVPNNDADSVDDPRDVSGIRTKKVVQPSLFDERSPILYAWPLSDGSTHASTIVRVADELYQLGRGVDMAWAAGEIVDDDTLEARFIAHRGIVHRPDRGRSNHTLACPVPGSLASLVQRHRATKLRFEGRGKSAKVLFSNPPKPRFLSVAYGRTRSPSLYELRTRETDQPWPWPLHRVVSLVETLRDAAADRLRQGLPPDDAVAIEGALIGRKADGRDSGPIANRIRIVPLPSIGFHHADRAIRRILLEVPSGGPLQAADVEWAFSGLAPTTLPDRAEQSSFVLTRTDARDMLRHYDGPARVWRSVTPVVLPENAHRRRIEPSRKRKDAKSASERMVEEDRAVTALHAALRHADIRATAIGVRVQREPFEARNTRVEAFADGTRFAKERLWHVELEFDAPVPGPLLIGDGRFLGLGLLAPITQPWMGDAIKDSPMIRSDAPVNRSGLVAFDVMGDVNDDPIALARALRRAVMARVQAWIGKSELDRFFTGHERDGAIARDLESSHLAFHWDHVRRRLLVLAPHWLDHREPSSYEYRKLQELDPALDDLRELLAGRAGRFVLYRRSISVDDPLLRPSQSWTSLTPYVVTRHEKHSTATDALIENAIAECHRRFLPRPTVHVLDVHGIPGLGLAGHLRLDFEVAVAGPIVLGRARYLGGGLFESASLLAE